MSANSPDYITGLLLDWNEGDCQALDKLIPIVYSELHRLAANYMSRERSCHTLQPTALLNEVYLRLINREKVSWQGRAHFFGVAAHIMRSVLVDYARSQKAARRGGLNQKVSLDEGKLAAEPEPGVDLLELDMVLTKLETIDPQKSAIVELRFFGGLSVEETAEALMISVPTVVRQWRVARAWLFHELKASPEPSRG